MQCYPVEMMRTLQSYPDCTYARALLLVRGEEIAQVYYDTFSEAARKYQVTLVAGSAPIPGPPDGSVYNVSYTFGPDGSLLGVQKKVYLIPMEQRAYPDAEGNSLPGLDLVAGSLDDIHAVDTPAGRLGVAICYDAFQRDVIAKLVQDGARILVQPSFNPGEWTEEQIENWRLGTWTAVHDNYPNLIMGVNPMAVGGFWEVQVQGVSSIVGGFEHADADGYLARANDAVTGGVVVYGREGRR